MPIDPWLPRAAAMHPRRVALEAADGELTYAQLLEAARIDGASEMQVFRRIIVPSILPTIAVVTTYMVINALKVFDIVFVMGNAESDGTVVIAERMIDWFFTSLHAGRGAAIIALT